MGKYDRVPGKRLTRAQAIRAKCIDCMCHQSAEVRRCPVEDCSLWPYRMGHGEDKGDGPVTTKVSKKAIQEDVEEEDE